MRTLYLGVLLAAAATIAVAQVSPEEHAAHHPDAASSAHDLESMKHMKCGMEANKDANKDTAGQGGMMAGGGMMKCHEMTQARMDMMIEMMDQMMEHEDAERAPQKKR